MKNNIEKQNYFIAFLLLLSSLKASNFISRSPYILFFVAIVFILFSLRRGVPILNLKSITLLGLLIVYNFLYIIKFWDIDPSFMFFSTLTLFISIMAVRLLNFYDLLYYMKNLIYIGAVISFPFYLLQVFNHSFTFELIRQIHSLIPFSGETHPTLSNIIVWGVSNQFGTQYRNCGFMWEPGAFAAFLLMALVIELTFSSFKINRKIIVMVLALLTTQSTMGYVGLVAIIIYYSYNNLRKEGIKFVIGLPILTIVIVTILSLDFVWEKIKLELDSQDEITAFAYRTDRDFASLGRVGSFNADLSDLMKEPLLGIGGKSELMSGIKGKNINRTNGLSKFLLTYGIIGFLLFFYYMYISFKVFGKKMCVNYGNYPLFILTIIFILTFSNDIISTPLFFSFPILIYLAQGDRKTILVHHKK